MTDLEQHAEVLASYRGALITRGIPEDLASVLVIDMSKTLLSGGVEYPPAVLREGFEEAAQAKRDRRAAELAEMAQ